MKMLPIFSALIAFLLLSASVSLAAEGLDSSVGSDLPLNSQGVKVATLRATPNVSGSGILDVDGIVYAGKGAKIGPVGSNDDTNCGAALEGMQRYNSKEKEMQFCDGSFWKASSGSGKKCPSASANQLASAYATQAYKSTYGNNEYINIRGLSPGNLPVGVDLQVAQIQGEQASGLSQARYIYYFQCLDGAWQATGSQSLSVN